MIGMVKFQEPEVEAIFLSQVLITSVEFVYLRYGHTSLRLEPITSAMLCYVMLLSRGMLELSLSRTFVPESESSMYGTFALGNENVMELSFPRAKKLWNFRSQ